MFRNINGTNTILERPWCKHFSKLENREDEKSQLSLTKVPIVCVYIASRIENTRNYFLHARLF